MKGGFLVIHEDGRKGIAYSVDQHLVKKEPDYLIVRYFKGDGFKDLSDEKRKTKKDKLKTIGFID